LAKNGFVGVLESCCTTAEDRIRALTGSPLIKPTSTPLGSLTTAEAPLSDAENLFRQPGPLQASSQLGSRNL
ncbi:hypothetical protein, partial [Bradyrhizobium guangdongense]|uniref:hypothetical protein n=1 Tax=Bradyrhizobium guangdongense TaxID=1325090 RepID=UPI001AED0201